MSLPPRGREPRRIVAIGGGGFTDGPRDAQLERFIVELTERPDPRVCLLPTASGDPHEQARRFHATFRRLGARTSDVSLFRLGDQPVDLERHLRGQDAIYVGGGSLINLVAIWRAHGVDRVLRRAWEAGVVLAGVSAGSMCWFEAGITKSRGAPRPARGLGFLPGSNCVHYDGQARRRPPYLAAVESGQLPPGYAVDDGAALVFAGRELAEVVTARPGASARRVTAAHGAAVEKPLEARLLPPDSGEPADLAVAELRALHGRSLAGGLGR